MFFFNHIYLVFYYLDRVETDQTHFVKSLLSIPTEKHSSLFVRLQAGSWLHQIEGLSIQRMLK